MTTRLIDVENLGMRFKPRASLFRRASRPIQAVDGVSLTLDVGETLGVVGESGCGKSTITRCILRVYEPTAGRMLYHGRDGAVVDLASLDEKALRPFRRDIRLVFQDPQASLNPRMTVQDIIGEALLVNRIATGTQLRDRVARLMEQVGLQPDLMNRYPHAFSGGQRQRVGIARALATEPRLVVADEAVSALDVSIQAQTINLLMDLQRDFNLTYIFVSHDLNVVRHISTRVAVMYAGRLVEQGTTATLFARPRHPYTEALLAASPIPDPRRRQRGSRTRLQGEVADPADLPDGCAFHPRCMHATGLCRTTRPALRMAALGHDVACHHADFLNLTGAHA